MGVEGKEGWTLGPRPLAHWCDGGCVCFIHKNPMWYNPARDLHACQDTDCPFTDGYEDKLTETWETLNDGATEVERFRLLICKRVGLSTNCTLAEAHHILLRQYLDLRRALGQACASFSTLGGSPLLFIRDLQVAVAADEEVKEWGRVHRYTQLADDSPSPQTNGEDQPHGQQG